MHLNKSRSKLHPCLWAAWEVASPPEANTARHATCVTAKSFPPRELPSSSSCPRSCLAPALHRSGPIPSFLDFCSPSPDFQSSPLVPDRPICSLHDRNMVSSVTSHYMPALLTASDRPWNQVRTLSQIYQTHIEPHLLTMNYR